MIKDGRKKGLMINEIKISIYSNIPKTYSLGATYKVHKLNAGDHKFMLFAKTFALTQRMNEYLPLLCSPNPNGLGGKREGILFAGSFPKVRH